VDRIARRSCAMVAAELQHFHFAMYVIPCLLPGCNINWAYSKFNKISIKAKYEKVINI